MAETQTDEYHHGGMNAATQEADYRLFTAFAKWSSMILAVGILMLTLWFAVGAGFLGGLIPGIIAVVLFVTIFHRKPRQVH